MGKSFRVTSFVYKLTLKNWPGYKTKDKRKIYFSRLSFIFFFLQIYSEIFHIHFLKSGQFLICELKKKKIFQFLWIFVNGEEKKENKKKILLPAGLQNRFLSGSHAQIHLLPHIPGLVNLFKLQQKNTIRNKLFSSPATQSFVHVKTFALIHRKG